MLRVCSATVVLSALILTSSSASAYGPKVRKFCANDYFDHCNLHKLGTPELRTCMRKAGSKLTPSCVNALIQEGEVSAAEVAQRRAAVSGK